jgi:hypothetical protein
MLFMITIIPFKQLKIGLAEFIGERGPEAAHIPAAV